MIVARTRVWGSLSHGQSHDWNVDQLEQAVAAALLGLPYDADPDEPGVQVPAPLPQPGPRPGVVVNRLVRMSTGVDALLAQWGAVDAALLSAGQRERARAALRAAQEQIAAAMRGLGEG